jgi:hypothetical protein
VADEHFQDGDLKRHAQLPAATEDRVNYSSAERVVYWPTRQCGAARTRTAGLASQDPAAVSRIVAPKATHLRAKRLISPSGETGQSEDTIHLTIAVVASRILPGRFH